MPLENGVLIASIKTRGATAAALTSANPTLLARELCLETDTSELGSDGVRRYKAKLGPGNWNSLAYVGIGAGITEAQMQALITSHAIATDPHGDRAYADGLVNALGTAALADTGTAEGDVPVLGTGGKLPSGMLPPVAITDTFPVDDEVEMLALDVQVGDVAVRSDESKSYILRAEPASTLGNWVWLRTPTDAVLSVAGLTGAILASDLKTALGMEEKADKLITLNKQTGTTYTMVLGDAGPDRLLVQENVSAITTTIPPNSSVPYPVGTVLCGEQAGAGAVTLAPGSDVLLKSRDAALTTAGQYAFWSAVYMGGDEWHITGDLMP